jgi:hypothetical protein
MIQSIRFRNFRALREVEVDLERLTVLAGPNGSGKTTVLEGIRLMSQLASADPRFVFTGERDVGLISSRGAKGSFELGLHGAWRGKPGVLAIAFPSIEEYPFADTYVLESVWGERRFNRRQELHVPGETHTEQPMALVLKGTELLALDPKLLAAPAYSDDPTPTIAPDGTGLAAVLADMAVSRPDDFLRLQDAVRSVVPQLIRVRLVRAKVPYDRTEAPAPEPEPARADGDRSSGLPGHPDDRGPPSTRLAGERTAAPATGLTRRPARPEETRFRWGYEIVFDMAGAPDIPARSASRGTLLALGLLAYLMAPERPQLVLLDDLEQGMHGKALAALVQQLRVLLAQNPRMQIIATTHSPALLDTLSAEEVRLLGIRADGSIGCAPLVDHPDYALLKHDMRPGELWTTVGDQWVARPKPRQLTEGRAP